MDFDLFAVLNNEQAIAASTLDGPVLIIAGAGSGKTRMICHRIAHMLRKGIPEEHILALTFTNKAAQEMASRVRQLTGENLPNLVTSTFHAFGMRILARHCHLLGYTRKFTIYDGADRISLLREVMLEEDLDPQAFDLDAMLHLFGEVKMGRANWNRDTAKIVPHLYAVYHEHMALYNAFDFDDLIVKPIELFTRFPEVLAEYRQQYTHVMVDEFQDTSLEQYRMVHLLAEESRNLCVVGDDDQSIYSWRGANYRNIMLFESDFPERKEIKLERNYRSTGTILKAANELIVHNTQRKEKALWTESGSGGRIVMHHPADEDEEVESIIREMRRISFEQQVGWDAFGILVRTNHLIPMMENALMLASIPTAVSGGQSFYERKEVKDTVAYLRVLANVDDDIALLRIINTPRRRIGRSTLKMLRKVAESHHCSLYSAIGLVISPDAKIDYPRKEPLEHLFRLIGDYRQALFAAGKRKSGVLKALMEDIGYKHHIASDHPGNDQAVLWRYKSVETFIRLFSRWERDEENRDASVFDYLQRLSLVTRDRMDDGTQEMKVSLMTMHASKGLEFDTVFLAGVEDHIVPHARTLQENPDSLEEERRLFYVAITRARRALFISSCKQRKRNRELVESIPSRFLAEISSDLFKDPIEDRELDKDETLAAFEALRQRLSSKET